MASHSHRGVRQRICFAKYKISGVVSQHEGTNGEIDRIEQYAETSNDNKDYSDHSSLSVVERSRGTLNDVRLTRLDHTSRYHLLLLLMRLHFGFFLDFTHTTPVSVSFSVEQQPTVRSR